MTSEEPRYMYVTLKLSDIQANSVLIKVPDEELITMTGTIQCEQCNMLSFSHVVYIVRLFS